MKRITKEEAIELIKDNYYPDEIEILFAYYKDHPIELIEDGGERFNNEPQVRWVKTIEYSKQLGNDPNQMIWNYQTGRMTQEEYMDYNRQIGYSFYGYWEVFCFNEGFNIEQYQLDMREKGFDQLTN